MKQPKKKLGYPRHMKTLARFRKKKKPREKNTPKIEEGNVRRPLLQRLLSWLRGLVRW